MGGKTFVKPCTIDEGNDVKFSSFLCSWVRGQVWGKIFLEPLIGLGRIVFFFKISQGKTQPRVWPKIELNGKIGFT